MEGYKVFEPDWTCRGFQYEAGKTFEEDVTPSCCNRGFHFCKELKDCFNYYPFFIIQTKGNIIGWLKKASITPSALEIQGCKSSKR